MLTAADDVKFTRKQSEIAALVAQGKSNGEIADILFITRDTVRSHLKNIYKKMEFKTENASSFRIKLAVECVKKTLSNEK